MKKWFRFVVFFVVISVATFWTLAHSGGTDANGGHTNHSTGEYHYHHGYPAHQHTGGVCPYAYDNKTGSSSGGNSSSGSSIAVARDTTPFSREDLDTEVSLALKEQKEELEYEFSKEKDALLREKDDAINDCIMTCLFVVVGTIAISCVVAKKCIKSGIALYQKKEEEKKAKWMSDRSEFIARSRGRSCRELANVPADVVFSKTYFPEKIGGVSCVVFPNKDTTKYHTQNCRYKMGQRAVSVYRLPACCAPCKVCNPPVVDKKSKWVTDYQNYISIKKKYLIDDPDIPHPVNPTTKQISETGHKQLEWKHGGIT